MELNELERQEIYVLWLTGRYTLVEIAEWVGCHVETVRSIIKKKHEEQRKNNKKVVC